jgi:hypothetical protein
MIINDHFDKQHADLDTFFAQQHDWEKSVTENVATIGSIDDHVTTCIISTPTPTPVSGPSSSSAGSEEITHLTESDPAYLCRKNLSDEERRNILCHGRQLPMSFKYLKNKHDRRYNRSWEDTFPWLSYSARSEDIELTVHYVLLSKINQAHSRTRNSFK